MENSTLDLLLAIKNEDIYQVRFLLDAGVNVNEKRLTSESDNTALHVAAETGNLAILRLVLNAGADVKIEIIYGATALNHALLNRRDFHIIETMIEAGSDVNSRTKRGTSPLHFAARTSDAKVIKYILSKGADVNAVDEDGDTPLDEAPAFNSIMSHYRVMKILINHGATVNGNGAFYVHCMFLGTTESSRLF